jgi:hypothetical protein
VRYTELSPDRFKDSGLTAPDDLRHHADRARPSDGTFAGACRDTNGGAPYIPPNSYLGTAGGYEFWTNDRKKFSDLVIFVLGGIPNTVSSHIIGGTPSKATTTQFFTINGQPAAVTLPKANAR